MTAIRHRDLALAPAQGAAQHTVSHMLGEVTWLLTQIPTHKHVRLADMEWMILPALMLEQYRVFRASPSDLAGGQGASGAAQVQGSNGARGGAGASQKKQSQPIGYAVWALLSEEAEAKLLAGAETGTGGRLRPDEWKSGDRLWLVDMVVPKDNKAGDIMKACMTELFTTALKGKAVKFHKTDPVTGARDVIEFGGDA